MYNIPIVRCALRMTFLTSSKKQFFSTSRTKQQRKHMKYIYNTLEIFKNGISHKRKHVFVFETKSILDKFKRLIEVSR